MIHYRTLFEELVAEPGDGARKERVTDAFVQSLG
jgi:hypothetical protein